MPLTDTIAISFGNWIVAFYVVYALAAVALLSASSVLIDWSVNKLRASRVATSAKVSRRPRIIESRA